MKLYIKEKVFTWGDRFTVKDAWGEDRYFVEGEVFSWGKKLHVYDRTGREVAFIQQEVWSCLPRFYVYYGTHRVAEIRKEFSFFTQKYRIEGLDWEVEGSILFHEYRITRHGSPIVSISKEWMTWGDSYELSIADCADEILALAVVLTIDCVNEARSRNNG